MIDEAIAKRDALEEFLIQAVEEKSPIDKTLKALGKIAGVEIPASEMETYVSKMTLQTEEDDDYFEGTIFEPDFSDIDIPVEIQ
jgi:flagellum-specific ATP synthase